MKRTAATFEERMRPPRHARYGPTDRYLGAPAAGVCMSAFAIVKKGRKFLLGHAEAHPYWAKKWLFSWGAYSKEELAETRSSWLVPSTYLLEGEDPKEAVGRIMKEELQMPHYEAELLLVRSYNNPSSRYRGHDHWDLAFAYLVESSDAVPRLPWWKDLSYLDPSSLKAEEFGWNSDFVVDAGVLPKPDR